jgi:tetratricopeptide (TPR) repeat protein
MKVLCLLIGVYFIVSCSSGQERERGPSDFEIAMTLLAGKDYDGAISKFMDILEKKPTYIPAMIGLANARKEKMIILLQDAERYNKKLKNPLKAAIYTEKACQESTQAHKVLLKALQLAEERRDRVYQFQCHYYLGLLSYDFGTFPGEILLDVKQREKAIDHAISRFKKALEFPKDIISKNELVIHRLLGLALICKGRTREAKPHIQKYYDAIKPKLEIMKKNLIDKYGPRFELFEDEEVKMYRYYVREVREFGNLLKDLSEEGSEK